MNVSEGKRYLRKRRQMEPRTITKEISNDDLQSALELLYRSMGIISKNEEVSDGSFSKGPISITFTINAIEEQGVVRVSF